MLADEAARTLRAPDQRGQGRVEEAEYGAPNIERLAALDAEATSLCSWEPDAVPGLLQTPEYSAEVIRAANPRLTDLEVRRRMLLKSARREAFMARTLSVGLDYAYFIIPELAVVRPLGKDGTHALQLRHLLTMAAHNRVAIQVLPADSVPPGLAGHFTLYELEQGNPQARIGYAETVMGGQYSTRLDDMGRMHGIFVEMIRASMSIDASRTFLREALASWRTARHTSAAPTTASSSVSARTPETTALELPPPGP